MTDVSDLFTGEESAAVGRLAERRRSLEAAPPVVKSVARVVLAGTGAAAQDPFVQRIAQGLSFGTVSPEELEARGKENIALAGGGFLTGASKFAGTVAPYLATGIPAFNVGRAAMAAVVGKLSPSARAFLTATAAQEAVRKPYLLRGAQAAGGALGLGAESSTRAALEGEDIDEIADRGLKTAAITLAISGAAGGIGAVLGRRGVNPRAITEAEDPIAAAKLEKLEQEVIAVETKARGRVEALSQKITNENYRDPAMVERARKLAASTEGKLNALADRAWRVVPNNVERAKLFFRGREDSLQREADRIGVKIQKLRTDEMLADMEVSLSANVFGDATAAAAAEKTALALRRTIGEQAKTQTEKLVAAAKAGEIASGALDPAAVLYLNEAPVAAAGYRTLFGGVEVSQTMDEYFHRTMLQAFKSPETMGRQLGFTGTLAGKEAIEATREKSLVTARFQERINKQFNALGKALGISALRRTFGDASWANPVLEAFESGLLPRVRAQFGDDVARAWEAITTTKDELFALAGKVGALPGLEELGALESLGVKGVFPHMVEKTADKILEKQVQGLIGLYAKKGQTITRAKAEEILSNFLRGRNQGLRRVGNIDFNRLVPGTTAEKATFGFNMIRDPRKVLNNYAEGIAHRSAWGKRFGPNGELKDAYIEAAAEEGASRGLMTSLMDHYLQNSFAGEGITQVAYWITRTEVLAKMGLAALANFTQPVNDVLQFGLRNALGRTKLVTSGADRELIARSLGVYETTMDALQHVIFRGGARGPLDRATRHFLNANMFSPIEMLNRLGAGATGLAVARDISAKAIAGRLRGDNLAIAQRRMASLGLNLKKVVERGTLAGDDLEKAIYNAARTTQFLPDITRIPTAWQHPMGRILTQFSSFAFSQAKLVRDAVFAEAAQGRFEPLAYFLTLYPAAGELINNAQAVIKGRDRSSWERHGVRRYVENLAAVGAFGVLWSAAIQMKYGRGIESVLGPAVGDITRVGQNVAQGLFKGDVMARNFKDVQRLPSYRYGKLLVEGTAASIEPLVEALEGREESAAVDLDVFERMQVRRKSEQP